MSLYNMIHGVNPLAGPLLAALGLTHDACGRFRDCFLSRDDEPGSKLEIHVYTRNGGGNREDYEDVTRALRAHPEYIDDADDSFDCTYATYRFRVPTSLAEALETLVADHPEAIPASPRERFDSFMGKLKNNPEDAAVKRVTDAVAPMFEKIAEVAKP